MVERRPGVMPPKPGPPPPRQVPRSRILARRLAAAVAVVVLVGVGGWLAFAATRGSHSVAPPPTTLAAPRQFRVIFPEGFTRLQMAERVQAVAGIAHHESGLHPHISARTYLAATRARAIPGFGPKRRLLEGFLFPSTYDFTAQTTSRQLVAAQLAAFRQNWAQIDLRYARSRHLTPYDVLIIASLVEKEALAPDERPKIARVIYNRLRARMNLGIDATTRYGLNVPPTQSLTQSELNSPNPYNTRNPNNHHLPPTPIANPGLASIQAAAHPAAGDWLYFVRKPDRVHHYFTASYTDFVNYERAHGYIR